MWLRAKASWVKRAGLLAVTLLFLGSSILPSYGLVAVDTSLNSANGAQISTQRHIVNDGTYWRIFYWNGTHEVTQYSTGLTTWSGKTVVPDVLFYYAGNPLIKGSSDVKIYGNNIYLVSTGWTGALWEVRFINGTISGTTITWDAYTAVANSAGSFFGNPTISRSSTGRLWIAMGFSGDHRVHFRHSDDGGATWTSSTPFGVSTESSLNYGSVVSTMASGRMMFVYAKVTTHRPEYSVYTGAWGAPADISTDSLSQTYIGGLSLVADSYNADIQYLAWLDVTGGNNIVFNKYNSGWSAAETVASGVAASSLPTIAYDTNHNQTIVAWVQSDSIYIRNRSDTGTWGSVTQIGDMGLLTVSTPEDIIGSLDTNGNYQAYAVVTGLAAPFNLTMVGYYIAPVTTTTTTVSTLTTQTTTADTIVDAVANQFAAVMENLFPALIIILVFVYLAYKAGASGEVLAYVFIITLVLTSFINLMPWWITVIVSVIMMAILLNYRQRGGGITQ